MYVLPVFVFHFYLLVIVEQFLICFLTLGHSISSSLNCTLFFSAAISIFCNYLDSSRIKL